MALSPELLSKLVCPKSKAPLFQLDDALICPRSRLRYRIDNGVPVMLVDEADELSEAELARSIARARDLGLAIPT